MCPHLDTIGEVTKEDLLQKSKVGFNPFTVNIMHNVKDAQSRLLAVCVCVHHSYQSK